VHASCLGNVSRGSLVRSLFSNFAGGLPALGLLIIRIAAGTSPIVDGITKLHISQPALPWLLVFWQSETE
jgi:hypothetical protein